MKLRFPIMRRGIVNYKILAVRLLFLALFVFLILSGRMLLWLGLYAVSLLVSVIFGRIYCGYICPMNTLMIPTSRLSNKLRLKVKSTPRWLGQGYVAWAVLLISVAAMLLAKRFLHISLPVLPIWMLLAVLITIRYKPAVFHNLVCPFGALHKITGRFAFLSKKVVNDECIGCKICEDACPADAIKVRTENRKAAINPALCHQCAQCQNACKKKAIVYGGIHESII